MIVCPCRDCTDRQCGCHSHCEKYKGWRKEYDERKKKIDESKHNESEYLNYVTERKRQIFKQAKHRKKF